MPRLAAQFEGQPGSLTNRNPGQPVHPQLNLPYGQWIPIAEQERTGALWYNKFLPDTIALMEALVAKEQAFIMHRRKSKIPTSPDYARFQRVLWLCTPLFVKQNGRPENL